MQELLAEARDSLDSGPLTFGRKRQIVTRFVHRIDVATQGEGRAKTARVRVRCRFSPPAEITPEATRDVGDVLRA